MAMQETPERRPLNAREKREYPKIELGEQEDYRYFSQSEVADVLVGYGYGENMRRVHGLYLHRNSLQAVGVWHMSQEEGHFIGKPVLRGVEQAEAIGQTLLVAMVLSGRIPKDMSPRLTSLDIEYKSTAIPPFDLNTVVLIGEPEKQHELIGYGEVRCGENILSQGYIGGVILENKLSDRVLERVQRQQERAVVRFPLRG